MPEVTNVYTKVNMHILFWENLQLLVLAGTVAGQIITAQSFIIAQVIWLVCNLIAVVRDFVLKRPFADKIKDAVLTGITAALVASYFIM